MPGSEVLTTPTASSRLTRSLPPLLSSSPSGSSSSSSSLSHFSVPSSSEDVVRKQRVGGHSLSVGEVQDILRQMFPVLPKKSPHPCYTWLRGFQECIQANFEDQLSGGRRESLSFQPKMTGVIYDTSSDPITSAVSSSNLAVNTDNDQGQSTGGDEPQDLRRQADHLVLMPLSSHQLVNREEEDDDVATKDRTLTSSSSGVDSRVATTLELEKEGEILAALVHEQERQQQLQNKIVSEGEDDDSSYGPSSLYDSRVRVTSQKPRILPVVPQSSSPDSARSPLSSSRSEKVEPQSNTSQRLKVMPSNPKKRPIPRYPKRALECLKRCIIEGQLHVSQCHSICWKGNDVVWWAKCRYIFNNKHNTTTKMFRFRLWEKEDLVNDEREYQMPIQTIESIFNGIGSLRRENRKHRKTQTIKSNNIKLLKSHDIESEEDKKWDRIIRMTSKKMEIKEDLEYQSEIYIYIEKRLLFLPLIFPWERLSRMKFLSTSFFWSQ